MSDAKITVHWLNNSRAQRILWLLEELGLEYDIKKYSRDKKTMLAPAELRGIHPLGKSPVVTIEENGKTITLAESGAICEFLIERYGKGKLSLPADGDAQARADYLYFLHYAEGSIMLPLMFSIVFAQQPKQAPWLARPIVSVIASQTMSIFVRPRLKENFGFLEKHLEGKEFFAGGTLTGADIMLSFPVEGLQPALGYEDYPNLKAWFERMSERPAYKRAIEKGGVNRLGAFTE
ncbi:glutathione S-transferase [Meredithblackwellia eburnea MCA 4105]